MTDDKYLTQGETLLLLAVTLGPPLVLGVLVQSFLLRSRGVLQAPPRARAVLSIGASVAMTIVLALGFWFAISLAELPVLGPYGVLFAPPWLSALVVFTGMTHRMLRNRA